MPRRGRGGTIQETECFTRDSVQSRIRETDRNLDRHLISERNRNQKQIEINRELKRELKTGA